MSATNSAQSKPVWARRTCVLHPRRCQLAVIIVGLRYVGPSILEHTVSHVQPRDFAPMRISIYTNKAVKRPMHLKHITR
jgi:hypothetical protein